MSEFFWGVVEERERGDKEVGEGERDKIYIHCPYVVYKQDEKII